MNTPEIKPPYRPLFNGERIENGDEYFELGNWHRYTLSVGDKCSSSRLPSRTTRPNSTNIAPKTDFYPRPSPCRNYDPKGEEGKEKPQLQLIPPALNTELAKALSFGAARYEPWNWRKNKVEYMTYLGAIKRHIDALLEREDVASDSGVHHLGHIAASCAIVLDATKHGTLVDNRPPANLNSEPVVDSGAFKGVE